MRFEVLTDIGRKRTVNEDGAAVYTLPDGTLLAVIADGMGGHRGGDYASRMTIRLMGEQFMNIQLDQLKTDEDWKEWLLESVFYVNRYLFNKASADEQYKGMGTTLDAVLIRGSDCQIVHAGDSRVYQLNQKDVKQITKDHSYVNVLLENGEITEEQAANHPQRNWIMKAVGSERRIDPDLYEVDLTEDTFLLLCTDGLSNKLDEQTIHKIIHADGTLREKVVQLVQMANKMGGEDNISVILIGPDDMEVKQP
ncbi:Stp1/IreP family PP2C-type Ser/Thr phosphatase [Sporosarcina sp. HYO08]|uniref:Stp1/IreP family PP2C-type Ser/Thr phosphatase n=1 Tax=Sporosarcina sp. HYO08 TaxID=1759557 RepID=UPI000795EAC0|nr:Stp1/IreP family PP2C-type Ser/Thr phosphatase [Sporosarcina sp. HYO08]KXH79937.1 hypothetical protein AU377_10700 [Sporosarcina sp. HYO08]